MKVLEYVEKRMEQALEYVETEDYGNNYSYLLESANYESRLPELLKDIDLKGVDLDSISENIYRNFELKVSYTMLPAPEYCLDYFPVQEIEEQFSFEEIKEATGKRLTQSRAKALGLNPDRQGYFYQYTPSDVVWCAVIDMEALLEFIEEETEREV